MPHADALFTFTRNEFGQREACSFKRMEQSLIYAGHSVALEKTMIFSIQMMPNGRSTGL